MSKRSNRTAVIGVLSALALGTLSAAPAYAKDGRVERRGTCSAGSQWKLKLSPDGSVNEAELEVDSNVVGQVWKVAIRDNGTRVFSGLRTTRAPSGSFTVTRRVPNQAGRDRIVAAAKNSATGESCVGRASI